MSDAIRRNEHTKNASQYCQFCQFGAREGWKIQETDNTVKTDRAKI